MIRAIIFDCFGVLTTDSWHEFRVGLDPSVQAKASDLNRLFCSGSIDREKFLESVARLANVTKETVADIVDNELDKNKELLRFIAELRDQGYKIGLLSNVASNWILDVFLTPQEQKLFDSFVFSFEVGMTKPDPRIYRLAADRLGVIPAQCVFIDDIDRLCQAAERVGMKTVVYQNFQQMKPQLQRLLADSDN